MKQIRRVMQFALVGLAVLGLAACGNQSTSNKEANTKEDTKTEKKTIVFGATTGPYADMVKKAIQPGLEKKGYKVDLVEFTDYIQPNNALNSGEIDVNLFQNITYMKSFAEKNKMDLTAVVQVPTAPMGLYSSKFKSLEAISDGSEVALPSDTTNAARAYKLLAAANLATINKDANPLTIGQKDLQSNPKELKFLEIEAAGLPRAVDSSGIAAVPGNFALAAGMDLTKALILEKMEDNYRNQVVVRTENKDDKWVEDIVEVVKSKDFDKVIDTDFKGFDKPDYTQK